MRIILSKIRPYRPAVFALVILLVVQAFCDLSLPIYTSKIIDVGVTNRGVEHFVPEKITGDEYSYALMFMKDDEAESWAEAFGQEADNTGPRPDEVLDRKVSDEEELTALDEKLRIPLMMDYQMSRLPEGQFRQMISGAIAAGGGAADIDIDSMSLDQIIKLSGTDLNYFTEKDEEGKEETYIDVRPAFIKLAASGAYAGIIDKYRETEEKMVDTMGPSMLMSMGAAYASGCDEKAGVDMSDVQMSYMWSIGWKMLLFALLILLAAIGASYIASGIAASIGKTLRRQVFHNVMRFSNRELEKFSTASLITRSTNDVQQVQIAVVLMLRLALYAPIIGIGGILMVVRTHAGMEWIIALAVFLIMILVAILLKVTLPKFRIMQTLVDNLNMISREILTGLPVIRAFGREREEEKRFDSANVELTKTQLFTSRTMVWMMPGMTIIMYAITLLIVWVSAKRIDAGNLQIGTMTAFITYTIIIVISFLMITVMSIILPRAGVAAERIEEVLNTETSITDPEEPAALPANAGEVEFCDVEFIYPEAEKPVLEGISFTALPGQTTAIIGSTGSGKSTLINLIPRFYDVTGGVIKAGGVDIRELSLKDLRGMIGFVPQKGVLFSGTIASNLRFGKDSADEDEMVSAIETSQASEFVFTDEKGLEREISQGGTNVSGGQKQRLAIARAVVRRPKIMVFDDSFSALDMKTDAVLRKALRDDLSESTVIIVAQRISTIMKADQIIVLEHGRMAGKGTHDELMKTCEIYREIARSQLSDRELGIEGGEQHG